MDLTSVDEVRLARSRADLVVGGDVVPLAGGTGLFAGASPRVLVDLLPLAWPAVATDADGGLTVAATCTVADLVAAAAVPGPGWRTAHLVLTCADALVMSAKIWRSATVGGNVCLALPAGAMTTLLVAHDATALVWAADGGDRTLPVAELVTGAGQTGLRPGEVVRSFTLPARALVAHAVLRRAALTPTGRSGTIVVGRRDPDGTTVVTVTAGVPRPFRVAFPAAPAAAELRDALAAVPQWFDDVHGAPDWRRAMTLRLAEEVRQALVAGPEGRAPGVVEEDPA